MTFETTRRSMLKGITLGAGGALLYPILDRLAAHAGGNERVAAPRRVVFVVQSNGINPQHITPADMQHPVDRGNNRPTNDALFERPLADLTLPVPIEALTPY